MIKKRFYQLVDAIEWWLLFCKIERTADEIIPNKKKSFQKKKRTYAKNQNIALRILFSEANIAFILAVCLVVLLLPGKTANTEAHTSYAVGGKTEYIQDDEKCVYYRVAVPTELSKDDLLEIFHTMRQEKKYYLCTVHFFVGAIEEGNDYIEIKETPECLKWYFFR